MRLPLFLLSLTLTASAKARLGETPIQFADRYGRPADSQLTKITDTASPLVEGAIHHTYEYQGWRIRAAFLQLDGPAVRMDFQKLAAAGVSPVMQDYELQALAAANTPAGMEWKRIAYDNPDSPNKAVAKMVEGFFAVGQKVWRRTDGAILWLRSGLMVRLELPVVRQYEEQVKVAKDQKARSSVPKF